MITESDFILKDFDENARKLLHTGLDEHALRSIGERGIEDMMCCLALPADVYAGGVAFQVFWGALNIKLLHVDPGFRRRGLGKALMERAFEYGKKRGCEYAFVETFNFQAPEFYIALGFEHEFSRRGYSRELQFHYLKKKLR